MEKQKVSFVQRRRNVIYAVGRRKQHSDEGVKFPRYHCGVQISLFWNINHRSGRSVSIRWWTNVADVWHLLLWVSVSNQEPTLGVKAKKQLSWGVSSSRLSGGSSCEVWNDQHIHIGWFCRIFTCMPTFINNRSGCRDWGWMETFCSYRKIFIVPKRLWLLCGHI